MIQELRKLIDVYLEGNKHRTLHTLSQRAGVSYSTVRRIAQGEVKTVDLANALGILTVVADLPTIQAFLKANYPEAGTHLENIARSGQESLDPDGDVEAALFNFEKFVTIALASTPAGTTSQQVTDVLGLRASKIVADLLAAGILVERGARIFQAQKYYASLNVENISAQFAHCLRFVKPELIGKNAQHLAIHTDGVTPECQRQIYSLIHNVMLEIDNLVTQNPGPVPVFYGATLGTFLPEGSHA